MIVVINDKIFNSEKDIISIRIFENEAKDLEAMLRNKHDIITFAPKTAGESKIVRNSAPLKGPKKVTEMPIDTDNLNKVFGNTDIPIVSADTLPIGNNEEKVDTEDKDE